jgi:hypothetical protein
VGGHSREGAVDISALRAANVCCARPSVLTAARVVAATTASNREERARELLAPVLKDGYYGIKEVRLSTKSFSDESVVVLADVLSKLPELEIADMDDIISGRMDAEALRVIEVRATAGWLADVSALACITRLSPSLQQVASCLADRRGRVFAVRWRRRWPSRWLARSWCSSMPRTMRSVRAGWLPANQRCFRASTRSSVHISATTGSRSMLVSLQREHSLDRHSLNRHPIPFQAREKTCLTSILGLLALTSSWSFFWHARARVPVVRCVPGVRCLLAGELMTEIFTAKGPSNLKLLHVHNNMLGEGGAKNISPLVSQAPHLEDFRFSTTRVPEAGGKVLGAALGHATKLKRLNLSDNTYGIAGATSLAGSLAKMPDMEWLNLCDTGKQQLLSPRMRDARACARARAHRLMSGLSSALSDVSR